MVADVGSEEDPAVAPDKQGAVVQTIAKGSDVVAPVSLDELGGVVTRQLDVGFTGVGQAKDAVDPAAVADTKPLGNALAVFAQRIVERAPTRGEVGPVAGEAPALDEAEHLWADAAVAVQLLEGGETLAANEENREALETMVFALVNGALKYDPTSAFIRAFTAKECVIVSSSFTVAPFGCHLKSPIPGDIL